jgi:RNA polymerase sigma factor (sigma-70 family)
VNPPPFDTVVAEHGPVVWRVCRALLGPADAEDAWSETFLSALRGYPDLRAGSDVRAWLVTIAHRRAVDQVRARARAPVPTGDPPEVAGRDGIPEPPEDGLWAALAALPERQRLAVVHHHLAGLPYARVGELLGSSEAAARRSAADGIAGLRRTYGRVPSGPVGTDRRRRERSNP